MKIYFTSHLYYVDNLAWLLSVVQNWINWTCSFYTRYAKSPAAISPASIKARCATSLKPELTTQELPPQPPSVSEKVSRQCPLPITDCPVPRNYCPVFITNCPVSTIRLQLPIVDCLEHSLPHLNCRRLTCVSQSHPSTRSRRPGQSPSCT